MTENTEIAENDALVSEINEVEAVAETEPEKKKSKLKIKKPVIIVLIAVNAALLTLAAALIFGIPFIKYRQTVSMMEKGEYEEAIVRFTDMGDYLDSENLLLESKYMLASKTKTEGKYEKAAQLFNEIITYKDSSNQITDCNYLHAEQVFNAEEYAEAMELFKELGDYKDSADRTLECRYQLAVKSMEEGEIEHAYEEFRELGVYKDCQELFKSLEPTYKLIQAKPKIFVNKNWDSAERIRVWLSVKVIDENNLDVIIEGSNGAFDNSEDKLKGKWNKATGKVDLSGKSYRTVWEWDERTGEEKEKTYCEDDNVTGVMYYKDGCLYVELEQATWLFG